MADKTIIVGDLHLGSGNSISKPIPGTSLNSRVLDKLNILNWILDTAVQNDVNRIIFTGDIFQEVNPETQLIILFIDWLKQCNSASIDCHIIYGNHDLKRIGKRYSSVLDIISSAEIPSVCIHNEFYTLHTEDICYTFLPFRDKRALGVKTMEEAIESINASLNNELILCEAYKKKVLIGHLALEGSIYTDEVDDVSNEIMYPIENLKSFDYVFMGHVHTPQVFKASNYVSHIGSADLSDFGECNQVKKIALIDDLRGFSFNLIDIPSRPLKRFRIEIQANTDPTESVLSELKKVNLKEAIVKIEVKYLDPDSIDLDREKISNYVNDEAYHLAALTETRNTIVLSEDSKVIETTEIEPGQAVDIWSEKIEHVNDEEREMFDSLCKEVINDVLANSKKGH